MDIFRIEKKSEMKYFSLVGLCVFGFSIPFCPGCASPKGKVFPKLDESIVWPKPPEQGRLVYIGTISTEDDLKRGVSFFESLGELIFGKEKVGVLIGPSAVAFCDDESLLVADGAGGVVHNFNLSTRDYHQFGPLSKTESLMMPVALALIDNHVYVVDSMLHKVCVFTKDGKYKFSFGHDRLKRPTGIAYWPDGGKIFISDTGRHVIEVFDTNGRFENTIGSRGGMPGAFNFPTHLWVDKGGKLYVSDTLNYRVQIFSPEGKYLKMFGEHGDGPGYFAHPSGVATDNFGHIYVVDRQFENIQIFDDDGQVLMSWGEEGSGVGEFWLPGGMYIDGRNRIYVADSFNKRIQVFELLPVETE